VTGTYEGTIDFGIGPLPPSDISGDVATFFVKLDPNGKALWAKGLGVTGDLRAADLAVDGAGHTILTGGFFKTVDLGDGPVTGQGYNDLVVAKFDGDGKLVWKRIAGDGDVQYGASVAVAPSGHVLLGGVAWGTINLGTGPLTSKGKEDTLVAKLAP